MSGIQELFNMFVQQAKTEGLSGNGMIGLGELHTQLLAMPEDALIAVEYRGTPVWAGELFSYRGYYEDLSFDLGGQTTVADTLNAVEAYFDGKAYEGYKGGEYYAHYDTLIWVSPYGDCSGIGVTGIELDGDKVFLTTVDTDARHA